MIYLKSVIAGILTLVLFAVLAPVIVPPVIRFAYRLEEGAQVSWDLRFLSKSPVFWTLVLLIFGLGFYWEFRRLSK